jgi:Ca2+-binding RTX toxin-like protein
MAIFTANQGLSLQSSTFGYSSTVSTASGKYVYGSTAGFQVSIFADPGDLFTMYNDYGGGNILPANGTAVSFSFDFGGSNFGTITGLNLPASGNFSTNGFSGDALYNAIFGGDDLFNANGFFSIFYGDFGDDIVTNGTRIAGNDTFQTGASSQTILYGDAGNIGTIANNAGAFTGGDDQFQVGASISILYGDVKDIKNGTVFGGDDQFTVAASATSEITYGDAVDIFSTGKLFGGDDTITSQTTGNANFYGDANLNNGGFVEGGDDTITTSGAATITVYGDLASNQPGGFFRGGDDIISVTNATATAIFGDLGTNSGVAIFGNDTITGSANADVIIGDASTNTGTASPGNDIIHAGDGDDVIYGDVYVNTGVLGPAGNNTIYGEGGADVIVADTLPGGIVGPGGNHKVFGGQGNDIIYDGTGDSLIKGGADDDMIFASSGNDIYDGGLGIDALYYTSSTQGITVDLAAETGSGGWATGDTIKRFEKLHATNFADTITGSSGGEEITTYDGNDIVNDGLGDDIIDLGNHDDLLISGGGTDSYDGGSGIDTLSYRNSFAGVTVDIGLNTASGGFAADDTIVDFENLTGSKDFDDVLKGSNGNNIINGLKGNDTVYTRNGNDTVNLGKGDDIVKVGDGIKILNGGDGIDTVSYYNAPSGVIINLELNSASGSWSSDDTISGFENAYGSNIGDDSIYDSAETNVIKTNGGKDYALVTGGDDKVFLGEGHFDYVEIKGDGAKTLDGGAGLGDKLSYYFSGSAGVVIDLFSNTTAGAIAGNDTISGFESAIGSNTGHDTLKGSNGDNELYGYYGRDRLFGRNGDDRLDGGSGKDLLDGGHGNDRLYGGAGLDTFHFDKTDDVDIIFDFEDNLDTIEFFGFGFVDVTAALANATVVGADVVFDFGAGDMVTVKNTTIAALADDIVVV